MIAINTSSVLGSMISNIAQYVLGDYQLLGVWLLLLFFGIATSFNIDFNLTLLLLIPLTVVCLIFGLIYPIMGGIVILFVGIILAHNFWFK